MRRGVCAGCNRSGIWVNAATLRGERIGEYCADCFERIRYDSERPARRSTTSGPNHNDPGFDNVVRALEEDR